MAEERTIRKRLPVSASSPTPGCIIFIIGIVGIFSLLGWFFYAGYKQAQEIKTFTSDTPANIAPPAPHPELLAATQQKLQTYAREVAEKPAASLTLNKEELNALIAGDAVLKTALDENFFQARVEELGARAKVSIVLRFNGWITERHAYRYLNGTAEFTPIIHPEKGLYLQLDALTVPGKTLPNGFLELYKNQGFIDDMCLKAARADATAGPALKKTNSVALENGAVVLKYTARP